MNGDTITRTAVFVVYNRYLERDSICLACYILASTSVCLSHGWISQKRFFKLGLCNFHHTVAQSL